MPFSWSESLATGSETSDQQHRRLIAQVAGLADAMKQGKGSREIETLLEHLGQYVVQHFADEEKLMNSHCFDMEGVKPDKTITVKTDDSDYARTICLWTTPLKKG